MTKQNHIDYLYNSEYSKSENLTKTMVEVAINASYNQVCWDLVKGRVKNFDLCRKRFTNISVVWDSSADVYYSNYPAPIVPEINTEMIVSTIKGGGYRFNPSSEQNQRIVQSLASNSLNLHIPTILKRERVEYNNMESLSVEEIENGSSPTPKIATVRMDLAIEFKGFISTDIVYMPAGRDYEVMQLAIDYLKQNPIMEVRNDG
jgi:hypothetical protein